MSQTPRIAQSIDFSRHKGGNFDRAKLLQESNSAEREEIKKDKMTIDAIKVHLKEKEQDRADADIF